MKKRHLTVMPGVLLALLLIGLLIGCSDSEDDPVVVAATGVVIDQGDDPITVYIGAAEATMLTAAVEPTGALQTVVWSIPSEDYGTATIDPATGTITAVTAGTVTVTVTVGTTGGSETPLTDTIDVVVADAPVAATSVEIDQGDDPIDVTIGTPITLTASVLPEGASQVVGWVITSDAIPAPATIGMLTGTVEGAVVGVSTVTVTAAGGDGTTLIQDSITVNVVAQ